MLRRIRCHMRRGERGARRARDAALWRAARTPPPKRQPTRETKASVRRCAAPKPLATSAVRAQRGGKKAAKVAKAQAAAGGGGSECWAA